MLAKIKKGLKTRKVKLFFTFLLCSFFAWFISNLSESYISNATFDLDFINIPNNRMLVRASKEKLDVKIEAVGFQFLRFNFKHKRVAIDLSEAREVNGHYFVTKNQYQKQIDKQLSSSMGLVQIMDDTLFFELKKVVTRVLPVDPTIEMTFEKNYLLDGKLMVDPSKISVTGPTNEVDTIMLIRTQKIELAELSSDFSKTVLIVKPDSLLNSTFSAEQVVVSGKVSRFSEKVVKVRLNIVNLPKNIGIATFPEEIEVLCKATVEVLKNISPTDFKVIADYNDVVEGKEAAKLPLRITERPSTIVGVNLLQHEVSYILKSK